MKLLIIDDNVEFANLLKQYVSRQSDIEVLEYAKDGLEGVEAILKYKPDVVILDIIMPHLDGIGVLEKCAEMSLSERPSFVVLSASGNEKQVKHAMQLGADYYIVKPFDIDVLIQRIYDTYEDKSSKIEINKKMHGIINFQNDDAKLILLLHQLGIKANLSGYRFLKEAIKLAIQDERIFSSVTKVLYPQIAQNCNSTGQKVERAIRNAIECAWKEDCGELRVLLFGKMYSKPSNSQFISTLAERLKSEVTRNFG